ncbi:MAG: DUF1844 domain-containing protein [Candidatus Marinimicrobia bacterium]|nr:DUF1844 domain-containing protein [Candidatus Neomarinimicrobiota bacterium]
MGLVYSLTQSAFIGLGKLPDPMSGKIEKNLPQASQTIDLLAALKDKTAGNLEEEEAKFLEKTISELRLNYVDEVNKPKSEKKPEKEEDSKEAGKNKEKAETDKEAAGKEKPEEKPEDQKPEGKAGKKSS